MNYYNSEMAAAIGECVHNDRDRLVLQLRLIDGWTHERIAEHPKVDRTPKQVYNIMQKYTATLLEYIQHNRRQEKIS